MTRVATDSGKRENRENDEKNSLCGKITEFDKNKKIRGKSDNFTSAVKKVDSDGFFFLKIFNSMRINFKIWQNSNTL